MSLYTIVFIIVTILVISGLALFGILISKLDKWIDKKERLGRESIYKKETVDKQNKKME
jgi:anionic cell wall polymer biosynthesis LytR-Cps2A-Psr (LCP) family protein